LQNIFDKHPQELPMPIALTKVFTSPGPHPNGLQATTEGLWILDQGNNRVSCHAYKDGALLKMFDTDSDRGSGITDSGAHLWLASTYSCEILQCDRRTGETVARYATPGASRTGAHGLEWKDGDLWMAVPPSATIYRLDPDTWTVKHAIPAPGNRPHGIAWENGNLWCVETNHRAIYLLDPDTGEHLDRIAIEGPEPHGFTIWQGEFWIVDAETGEVFRGRRVKNNDER
jgi:streptogramin lyase